MVAAKIAGSAEGGHVTCLNSLCVSGEVHSQPR